MAAKVKKPASEMTREELEDKNRRLEAHVKQLQNVIAKSTAPAGTKILKNLRERRNFDFKKYNTRHVALKIVYLGWDYLGFASQEDTAKTIEAGLFDALVTTRLIEDRETSNYHRCGRTDKGVSAQGQVISLDVRTHFLEGKGVIIKEDGTAKERAGDKTTEIRYAHILNKVLPPEIRVLAWCPVEPEFSARFSCVKRTYKYFFPKGNLDIETMNKAAQTLIGLHDFRNFCKMDIANGVIAFNRRILDVSIKTLDDKSNGYQLCELTVVGIAFLWHQIRCIVAILFLIGERHESPEIIDTLLDVENNPRKPQYHMASELPLVLYDCEFEDFEWIYEEESHTDNIKHMQAMWAQNTIKHAIAGSVLDHLHNVKLPNTKDSDITNNQPQIFGQAECLIPGNRTKVYKPLMERDKCESLEDRIEHEAKRRRIHSNKQL